MKRIICIIVACFMLLSLAACEGKDEPAEHTAAPTQAAMITEPAAVTAAPEACATPVPPKVWTEHNVEDFNNRYGTRASGMQTECFEMEDILFMVRKYLYKPTGECGYYCTKPECMHNDESCEAYSRRILGWYDGKLYYTAPVEGIQQLGGIYTMDIVGSNKKLLYEFEPHYDGLIDCGAVYFHRGKYYSFYNTSTVVDGVPKGLTRFTCIDPNTGELFYILDDTSYPSMTYHHEFFRDNELYMMLGYEAKDDSRECGYRDVWELLRFDIDARVLEHYAKDEDVGGTLRGFWITEEGEIYAISEDYTGDWHYPYPGTVVKLEDGRFVPQWSIEQLEGRWNNTEISDGTVITKYTIMADNPDQIFRIQDFSGNIIAEGGVTLPELVGDYVGARLERLVAIWSDGTCLWVEIWYQKPIKMNNLDTFQPMWTFVKYDITPDGFVLSFCDLEAEL